MRMCDLTVENFISNLKHSDKKLVLYGYGVIGKIVAPYFIQTHGLAEKVLFVVDADVYKQGNVLELGQYRAEVCGPEKLSEVSDKFVILITGSRYDRILSTLESFECLADTEVYILPKLLAGECHSFEKQENLRLSDTPQIPKMIHYCWFGDKEIPNILRHYMESWSKFCPDYQIIRWSEKNFDLQKYKYTEQAYKNKRWGFIPDIVRLDVLNEYGGIYLDTDVELLKPLDDLLYQPGFCGVEKWGVINIGGGCGAVPGHPMIRKILDYRTQFEFEYPDGTLNLESSGSFETAPLIKEGFRPDNTIQCIDGLTVYSSDFFHPYDYMSQEVCLTENTYSIHHFYGSWV